jgi:poly(A) polymerase
VIGMEGSAPKVAKRRIEAAPWLSSQPLRRVFAALVHTGHETRVIGGAVRNTLLNLPVSDLDLATTLTPEDVIERTTKAGLAVYPTGLAHGTVTVVADGASFEVTTLRRDTETDGRHAVVAFTKDWHEDALRRDFTINALSCDAEGQVYDSVGGLEDLDARRVRFIGKAEDRIREDYLRILRFFRLTAAYSVGEPDTRGLAACLALKDGLTKLSAERIGSEIKKFIVTPRAGEIAGIMNDGGIFTIIIGQTAHPDVLRNLQAIENALDEDAGEITRLAALFAETAADARAVALRLRFSNTETSDLAAAADVNVNALHMASEAALKGEIYVRGATAFKRVLRVAWARSGALANDLAWKEKSLLATHWIAPQMPFTGNDVMALGVPAGPRVGRTLKAFEAWWIEAGFPADRDAQKTRLAALAQQS